MSIDWYSMPKWKVTGCDATMLDCCMSCYFQGSAAPEVLAVPVWPGMTYRQAYEACKDEFHATDGYFDMSGAGSIVEGALRTLFGSSVNEDTDAVADFAPDVEIDPVTGEPYENDDGDMCFLYIALTPVFDDEDEDVISEDGEG